jgi:hypothetical protein
MIIMRKLIIFLTSFFLLSCNSNTGVKSTNSKQTQSTPDFSVALKFINDYAKFCEPKSPPSKDSTWIERNTILTKNFKIRYKNLLDSALIEEPDVGLDFDPIFDGQDFPYKGFEILSYDNNTGFLIVKGKDWPAFVLTMKVVNENGKWLVDGSGIINIPKVKVARK